MRSSPWRHALTAEDVWWPEIIGAVTGNAPVGEIAQTLDRGLEILERLAMANHGLTTAEIAAELGISRSAVARLLTTLKGRGFVTRDHEGGFRLGLRFFSLAQRASSDVRTAATPLLTDIAERFGMTAVLHVADGLESVTLLSIEPKHASFHLGLRTGSRHPLDHAAHGVAILAGRAWSDGEPAAVTEARSRGYAESTGEVVPNCTGISVPVISGGRCDASIGVVFPTGRTRDDENVLAALRSAADEIAALVV